MKKRLTLLALTLIVVAALFFRTNRIGSNPPSLSWDEVSIGYNAYSILKTGSDEHRRFLPVDAFAAYGDYKPPFSIYLTVPFVAVFGLTEVGVRLPVALMGSLAVFLTYFLVHALLTGSKKGDGVSGAEGIALLAAGLLAFSPWHINLSRAGFEAVIASTLTIAGALLVLKARRTPALWPVAWIPFVLSMYTFNSSRYFAPLLGLGLLVYCRDEVKRHLPRFAAGVVIAALLLLPTLPHLLSKEARLRFVEVNIFTDPSVVKTANARIDAENGAWWAKILHNRRVGYARSYFYHFADNLEPLFLYIRGDGNPKFSVQDVGQLYIAEAPFLAVGLLAMFAVAPSAAGLLLWWLVAAIVPAATARETPHALRILNTMPTWYVFIAFGVVYAWGKAVAWAGSHRLSRLAIGTGAFVAVLFYTLNASYYFHTYYAHYPKEYSGEWQYGYREAFRFVRDLEKDYDAIYVTESIGRPYMYGLYYLAIDPREYWKTRESFFDAAGFYHVTGFGKYRFVSSMPNETTGKVLYIADSAPKDAKVLSVVKLLDGTPRLYVYEK